MKMGGGEIPEPEIPAPEPEFDEFGDRIVRPIENGRSPEGHIYVDNFNEWNAYIKQHSRNRDARMLERGEIDQAGLIRKNDIFAGVDFSSAKIVSIGDKKYEDID